MALNAEQIVAWLRLKDVARFVRDAKFAELAIKKLGKAGQDSESPLNALGGALGNLQGIMPKARTETGILGLTLGSLFTIATLGAPIIMSLAGALVALAGSLGAAALGAGVLGVAVAGAAIPLGAFALVGIDLVRGFTKVNTAFAQWQKAVSMYGSNSTQAETALSRLNAVAKQFGGPTLISLVQKWNDFMSAFRKANAPAIQNIIKLFNIFLDVATQLLPVFSYIAKVASGALVTAFKNVGAVLTSSGIGDFLRQMADEFAQLAGPLTKTFLNVFAGLVALATRAGPALGWLVNGLLNLSAAFKSWAQTGPIGGLIAQFKSWMHLLGAVGSLLVTILSAGAGEGKGLVDTLTHIVNKWNAWLNTAAGQKSMQTFFRQSIVIFKDVVGVVSTVIGWLWKLGRALMPIYIVAFNALRKGWNQVMGAIKPAGPFFKNVLLPLLKGVVEGVLFGLVGAFKLLVFVIKVVAFSLRGWGMLLKPLGGLFEFLGKVIGFVFGGEILDAIGALGKLVGFFKPIGLLFKAMGIPVKAAGEVVGWFGSKIISVIGRAVGFLAERFGFIRSIVSGILDFLTGVGSKFADAAAWLWKKFAKSFLRAIGSGLGWAADIGKAVYNFIAHLINKALPNSFGPIDIPNNPIPYLAAGGVVSGSGSWITGEAGPEISTLRDGRVTVVPLSPAVKAQGTAATLAPGEKHVLVSKIYLRGRQIAEAVADEAAAEAARK